MNIALRRAAPGWKFQDGQEEREPRADGSQEYAWHCAPFSESAQYGIELFYPYDNELIVSASNGELRLEGDFGSCPEEGLQWPPLRNFGNNYYTYQILLDLKVEPGLALRTEPHPRFLRIGRELARSRCRPSSADWWPMMFFMVFKSPEEGQPACFRPGEPFAQVIVIPEEAPFDIVEMGPQEAAEREMQARRLHASRDRLSEGSRWLSRTATVFDGSYRFMLRAAKAQDKNKEPLK